MGCNSATQLLSHSGDTEYGIMDIDREILLYNGNGGMCVGVTQGEKVTEVYPYE